MLFVRLVGRCLLFAAFIALAYDGARSLATPGQGLVLTTAAFYLENYVPEGRQGLEAFFLNMTPGYIWHDLLEPVLAFPVSILLASLGALVFLAGYRRPPPQIVGDEA